MLTDNPRVKLRAVSMQYRGVLYASAARYRELEVWLRVGRAAITYRDRHTTTYRKPGTDIHDFS